MKNSGDKLLKKMIRNCNHCNATCKDRETFLEKDTCENIFYLKRSIDRIKTFI